MTLYINTPTPEVDPLLTAGETALWRAVILQAVYDARSNNRKVWDRHNKELCRVWLTGNSTDFEMVCDYAGYNPEYIRAHVKKALDKDDLWRKPVGQGWRTKAHQAALERIRERQLQEAQQTCEEAANKIAASLTEYFNSQPHYNKGAVDAATPTTDE